MPPTVARRSEPSKKKSKRAKFRNLDFRLILLVGGLVVAAAAALFLGPKVYNRYRAIQIDENLEKAESAIRQRDWTAARSLARSVLLARPGEFKAFRIYHKASAEINDPQTYTASLQLFVNDQATTEDKLDAFRVLCNDAPQAVALSAYSYLNPETRADIRFRAAMVPFLLHRGEIRGAEGLLRESPDLNQSPEAKLQLIRILCSNPTVDRIKEARSVLADLIAGNHTEGLEGMISLGNVQRGLESGTPLPDLPAWVDSRSDAKPIHHLYALHPKLLESSVIQEPIFRPVVDRYLPVDPGAVGSWLVSQGQTDLAITLLEPFSKTDPNAYIEWTRALMKAGRFPELETALGSPPASVDLVDLEIMKTAVAFRRKDMKAANAGWEQVLQQAAFDQSRNRFFEINQFASLLGAPSVADDAMVAAIRIGWGRIPLYKDITPLLLRLAKANRTVDLLAIYRTMLRLEPENPELLNNFIYLSMLHELMPPAQAVTRLDELAKLHPKLPSTQSSIALACLLNGESQRALDIAGAQDPGSSDFPINLQKAIKGIALLDLGKKDEGTQLISEVNWSLFFTKEAIALRNYLSRLKVRGLELPAVPVIKASDDPENTSAWRKAVEALERNRANDVLPALPAPKMPAEYDLVPEKRKPAPAHPPEGDLREVPANNP